MSQITHHIFLGSRFEARDRTWLYTHGIRHIVNCTIEHPNYFQQEFNYLRLFLEDSPNQELSGALFDSFHFINNAIKKGENVLIHCHAGISRSSSIVIFFLMKLFQWDFSKAYVHVKSRHSITEPNPSFKRQLSKY